jgi:photosystem II stability/assembly factor-like uncharacterized protein
MFHVKVVTLVSLFALLALFTLSLFERNGDACHRAKAGSSCSDCHEDSMVRGDGLPPRKPNSWFFNQRAYPQGRIPREVWRAAKAQAAALKAAKHRSADPWVPRGPTNIGGRITDMAVHPGNGNFVYAAAAEGGVLRSQDGGQHWSALFDDQSSLAVGAVAIDPGDPDVVYAGTGEVNPGGGSVAYGGDGLYRSTDQGDTWSLIGLEDSGAIGRIRIDPSDSNRIFVAAMGHLWDTNPERGVYRTLDGGATWERVLYVNDSTGCVDLIMRPDDPNVILAAMWERLRQPEYYTYGGPGCAVWRTDDGGDTWSKVAGGLPTPGFNSGRIGLSLCQGQPDVMHAIYADKTGYFDGLYRSTNGGTTWTRTNDGSLSSVFSSYGWWFGNVRTHPVDPDIIYVLGLYFYRSTNGGASYSSASGIMHVDHHGLEFGPGLNPVLYNGNDGGVYRSTNGGTVWTKLPDLPVTQIYRVALDANNPDALYCGAQDNGTNRTLTGSVSDWTNIYGGDGFQPLVHPGNSNQIWAQYQYGSLSYSSSGGSSWSGATGGISYSDRFNWNCPLIQDPTNVNQRYFGTNRVYRSASTTSWTAISPDLTGGPHSGNQGQVSGTLTTLAVSPLDGNVIWAGSDDGRVQVTANGGGTWNEVSAALPDRWITSVRADPFDRETAFVTVSGFRWSEPLPHLFRTRDLGTSWEAIASNLPEAPVNDFAADPGNEGRYFVATDVGVYETQDEGVTWSAFGAGLPNVVVTSLALDAANDTLFAGTYGRSFFSVTIEEEEGSFIPYGTGLAGSGGFVPDLEGTGKVTYGGEVAVELTGGLGGTNGLVYVGLSSSSYPFLGGTLLVYPIDLVVPVVLDGLSGNPGGGSFSIPFTAYFQGLSIYIQVLLADSAAVRGVSMSNGLEIAFP